MSGLLALVAPSILMPMVALPSALRAQTPSVFHACYVPATGTIYRIKAPGLRDACASTRHVEFSWTDGARAVRTGDAAGGDLVGTYPNPSVAGLRGRSVAAIAPLDGQALVFDASQDAWSPTTFSSETPADHGQLSGLSDDDHPQYLLGDGLRAVAAGFAVAAIQENQSLPMPASGPGQRMMWSAARGVFRAGKVFGDQWDDGNIGPFSVAFGVSTTASGTASAAFGANTTASEQYATAMGNNSRASAPYSTAMGSATVASALASTAMGDQTVASGSRSTAMGVGTVASGDYSIAMGRQSRASGAVSTAIGDQTDASGHYSTAMGSFTTAQALGSLVLGQFNVLEGNEGSWISTDPLLVAGNGFRNARSNALTLLKNGDLTIAGTLTQNSDARFKMDIEPLHEVLSAISSLHGVRYRWVNQHNAPEGSQIGLLAQEVQQVFPELVREDSQGKLSVAYGNLTAVLLVAVQEQQHEIAALRQRIARLEATLLQDRLDGSLDRNPR